MRLIDTSIAIDHLRGRPEATNLLLRLIGDGVTVAASELVRVELLAGVRDNEIDALESFFVALYWVPVDRAVARSAGELARRYRKAYRGIDVTDFVIAATALLLKAELLTTNIEHFPMLEGLVSPY